MRRVVHPKRGHMTLQASILAGHGLFRTGPAELISQAAVEGYECSLTELGTRELQQRFVVKGFVSTSQRVQIPRSGLTLTSEIDASPRELLAPKSNYQQVRGESGMPTVAVGKRMDQD